MRAREIIDRRIRIENNAKSDVKLTKAGEKMSKASTWTIEQSIESDKKINYNEWIGIALNDNLDADMIRLMFKKMNLVSKTELQSNMSKATRTKNAGLREKVRRLLSEHPNANDDMIKTLLFKKRGKPFVLDNPSLKDEHIDLYIEHRVLRDGEIGNMDFEYLMKSKAVTLERVKKWYEQLKVRADWTYKDQGWYSIVNNLVNFDDLPSEILVDIAAAPEQKDNMPFSWASINRKSAVAHKNANEAVKLAAYKATGDEEYLPQDVKDVFVF